MVQSSFESLFNPSDFPKTMGKNAYPCVIGYNSRDHFCPTKPTTTKNYFNWKVQKELAPILSGGLLVIEELDTTHLDPGVVTAVKEVEDCILKNLPILSIHVNAAHHGLAHRAKPHRLLRVLLLRWVALRSLLLELCLNCLLPPHLPHLNPLLKSSLQLGEKKGGNCMYVISVEFPDKENQIWMGIFGMHITLAPLYSATFTPV